MTSDRLSFDESKIVLTRGGKRLFGVTANTNKLMIYSITYRKCTSLQISGLAAAFNPTGNWVLMNSNELLIGFGMSYTSFNEHGRGTGKLYCLKRYSIISVKDACVIKTGNMNKHRRHYGLVKI